MPIVERDLGDAYLERRQQTEDDDLEWLKRTTKREEQPTTDKQASQMRPIPSPMDSAPPIVDIEAEREVLSDVARGVTEIPRGITKGTLTAVQETLNFAKDAGEFAAQFQVGETGKEGPRFDFSSIIDDPESVTGQGVQAITQFMVGFAGAGKIKGMEKLGDISKTGEFMARGAIADAVAFDPHEERLSNMIQSVPALENPVNEFLASDPADSGAEGRFKNAVEGLVAGGLIDGLTKSLKAVRSARRARRQLDEDEIAEDIQTAAGTKAEDIAKVDFSAVDENLITIRADPRGRATNINLNNLDTTEDVKKMIDRVGRQYANTIDKERRGVQTNEATQKLANELGMTVEQLLSRRTGEAFNAEQALAARQILVSSGENLTKLAAKVAGPGGSDVDLLAFRRALMVHAAIQKEVSGLTAEAGRALQAFRIPAGGDQFRTEVIKDLLATSGGDGVSKNIAQKLALLNDPAAINKFVNKASRATTSDMVLEAWINGLLSSPVTHAINTTSNSLVALWAVPERFLAAGIGRLTGSNAIQTREPVAQAYGLVKGAESGFWLALKVLRSGEPTDAVAKIEARQHRSITAENFDLEAGGIAARSVDFLGELVRTPGRFLMAEDEFFKSVGYQMELNARAYRTAFEEGLSGDPEAMAKRIAEIVQNPPDDIHLSAIDAGRYQTFTKPLGETGRSLQTAAARHPALRVIVPFVRTPINIVKYAGHRSPMAPFMQSFRDDIAAGGARRDLALARMSLGSMAMMVAADMTLRGDITGGPPTDPGLREAYRRAKIQPYSIKIGDKWVAYNRLDPIGMTLGIAADTAQIMGQLDEADATNLSAATVSAIATNLVNKTYLEGLSNVIGIFSQPSAELGASSAEKFLTDLTASVVPSVVTQVERVMDPSLREARTVVNKIRARVPGFSEDLPPHRNLWGEPILLEGGLGPDIVSPLYVTTREEPYPIDKVIIDNQISIRMPSRMIDGVKMNEEEYSRFVELSGNELKVSVPWSGAKKGAKDALNDLVENNQLFQRASDGPDGEKARIIRAVLSAYREPARLQVIDEFPDLELRIKNQKVRQPLADDSPLARQLDLSDILQQLAPP